MLRIIGLFLVLILFVSISSAQESLGTTVDLSLLEDVDYLISQAQRGEPADVFEALRRAWLIDPGSDKVNRAISNAFVGSLIGNIMNRERSMGRSVLSHVSPRISDEEYQVVLNNLSCAIAFNPENAVAYWNRGMVSRTKSYNGTADLRKFIDTLDKWMKDDPPDLDDVWRISQPQDVTLNLERDRARGFIQENDQNEPVPFLSSPELKDTIEECLEWSGINAEAVTITPRPICVGITNVDLAKGYSNPNKGREYGWTTFGPRNMLFIYGRTQEGNWLYGNLSFLIHFWFRTGWILVEDTCDINSLPVIKP